MAPMPPTVEKEAAIAEQKEARRKCMLSDEQISQLTSFLEIDRSFFSPWNSVKTSPPAAEPKPRMVLETGSFIQFNIHEYSIYAAGNNAATHTFNKNTN